MTVSTPGVQLWTWIESWLSVTAHGATEPGVDALVPVLLLAATVLAVAAARRRRRRRSTVPPTAPSPTPPAYSPEGTNNDNPCLILAVPTGV
ncbi:hypothetical protein STSO111631_16645 [Stackebrandtia soli]